MVEFSNVSEYLPAIAEFLDCKIALIDKAISIKEKQIELLKERRQILIHRAVTRGINLNVKLKESGVEWIGEIPEHCEVKALKYCTKIFRGKLLIVQEMMKDYMMEIIHFFKQVMSLEQGNSFPNLGKH